MNRCLSEQHLLQCFSGEGSAQDAAHVKTCLACAARYRALQSDMQTIKRALEMPPPRRRAAAPRWRLLVPAAAVLAAFAVGWSLRGATRPVQTARVRSQPMQLAYEPAAGGAIYADYVQNAFGGDPCSDSPDLLEPGCF